LRGDTARARLVIPQPATIERSPFNRKSMVSGLVNESLTAVALARAMTRLSFRRGKSIKSPPHKVNGRSFIPWLRALHLIVTLVDERRIGGADVGASDDCPFA
jgi:hypothetical protein